MIVVRDSRFAAAGATIPEAVEAMRYVGETLEAEMQRRGRPIAPRSEERACSVFRRLSGRPPFCCGSTASALALRCSPRRVLLVGVRPTHSADLRYRSDRSDRSELA